jgi:O-6-methylguanine DNA methyltransferase
MKTVANKPSLFRESVYEIAAAIPAGKVATYGQIAALAGKPGAARAVGTLMRLNPSRAKVPCHRVVASDGALTGYAFGNGVATKKNLLKKEGVLFKGEKVDLAISQWQPKKL